MVQLIPLVPGDKFNAWRDKINEFVGIVNLPVSGSPVIVNNMEDVYKYLHSAGIFSGFEITDNGNGTVDVAAGEALLRWGTTGLSDPIYGVKVAITSGLALVDHDVNYVYLNYNAGSPAIQVTQTKDDIDGQSKILVSVISREGTGLTILEAPYMSTDLANCANDMLKFTEGFK